MVSRETPRPGPGNQGRGFDAGPRNPTSRRSGRPEGRQISQRENGPMLVRSLVCFLLFSALSMPVSAQAKADQTLQLGQAIIDNEVGRVRRLLAANPGLVNQALPDSKTTPLLIAVGLKAEAAMLRVLLAAGADVNCRDELGVSALMMAVGTGQPETVGLLLKNGVEPILGSCLTRPPKSGKGPWGSTSPEPSCPRR